MSESSIEESINLGAMGEALNDKMDRDGLNADIKPEAGYGVDYVVEWKVPTESDPTWYRKYASGWLEQGGIYTNANTTQPTQYKHTVTFSKPFKNTTYIVTALGWSSDDSNYYQDGVFESSTTPRTASTFTVDHENFVTKFCLKAEGMAA